MQIYADEFSEKLEETSSILPDQKGDNQESVEVKI
jgi:hypothetical protein